MRPSSAICSQIVRLILSLELRHPLNGEARLATFIPTIDPPRRPQRGFILIFHSGDSDGRITRKNFLRLNGRSIVTEAEPLRSGRSNSA
jgi:hypothetical protein